jgi:integrase
VPNPVSRLRSVCTAQSALIGQEVDRYRHGKVAERSLSVTSINKTLTRLAQILEVAVEYELIARNPAKGRRRRLKATRPRRVHLDSAEQIQALLDAAGELDADSTSKTHGRRPLVATLVFAGLRIGEACSLRWRDVDLAAERLTVGRAKTDAGVREVDVLPALRDELLAHKAATGHPGREDLVFPTAAGTARDKDNAQTHVIRPVVKRADELLAERGLHPLADGVTAHKLRHTFASILAALNEPMPYVMAQLGHADPKFMLAVYAHAMRRHEGERERLCALVEGREWAPLGTSQVRSPSSTSATMVVGLAESPAHAGPSDRWAVQGSNLRPPACKAGALAS